MESPASARLGDPPSGQSSRFSVPPARLRVLFLNPPGPDGQVWMKEVGRCGRRAVGGELWPQTGLAYLAAMVEREGHEARIIDGMAQPLPLERLEREANDWRPDIVIANSATPTIRFDTHILNELSRATAALCGFVGPHVSALPEETLRESTADFGICNEAEETVAELVRVVARLAAGHAAGSTPRTAATVDAAFAGIAGLVWRSRTPGAASGEICVNPARDMIRNLDDLPLPARHLLPNSAYRMPFFGNHPFATIIPSRGCPWRCSFCRAGRVWGRRIRVRSVGSVLAEIESLRRDLGIRHVAFMTDSLTLDREWATQLFDALAALPEPLTWVCNSRVDVVDAEMLGRMKRAGCRLISYGLESGSREVLRLARKGITLEQSERAIRLTREAGILSMAYFVLGLPGENAETAEQSLRFACRIDPDYVNFHIATPFPGTGLYEEARKRGWLRSNNWDDYEEEGSAVLQVGELKPADLEREQRRAMRAFYLRPRRLVRELARLRSWDDFTAKARAGWRMLRTLRKPAHRP